MKHVLSLMILVLISVPALAQHTLHGLLDQYADDVEEEVIAWRRDIHANPELSNREFRTAALVAQHLESLGLEVRTEVAHTGVVGLLRGSADGPVVALRADMDALPVTELVDVPFASTVRTTYLGQDVGVMHACGHDNHVAILMGVATVLSRVRDQLPGSVKFIFQPAEEGAPAGEEGGAELMLKEGAFLDPRPDAIFGLHVWPERVGQIAYRPGSFMASVDELYIKVTGRQTHGAIPWGGIDPIVVASQIILGLQSIASRQLPVTATPSIITVGMIRGGVRNNIIPDEVEMRGTIRTFLPEVRSDIEARIRRTAENIAAASGASVEVNIINGYPVTVNDEALTEAMLPTLRRVVGDSMVVSADLVTGAEDFSYFANEVPGLFVFLGITPEDQDPASAPRNHSPYFYTDEKALKVGVRTLANLAVDYMQANQ